jgi:hypothetical protein
LTFNWLRWATSSLGVSWGLLFKECASKVHLVRWVWVVMHHHAYACRSKLAAAPDCTGMFKLITDKLVLLMPLIVTILHINIKYK